MPCYCSSSSSAQSSSPAAACAATTTAQCDDAVVTDFVLIHSTGQGAAGWERRVRALAEPRHTAHAVELPNDPGLLAADYAELIRRRVDGVTAPIALAHSGSRPLLPASARALEARHQVWLAAWVWTRTRASPRSSRPTTRPPSIPTESARTQSLTTP